MIVDFRERAQPWQSIDDAVMGGLSASVMVVEDGIAAFSGELSLENNGGFASVRSSPAHHDLSAFDSLALRVRGDGRHYRFRMRTSSAFDGVTYQAPFRTRARKWRVVCIPFAAFEPVFRGQQVPDYPPLDPAEIQTFGLLIADRQVGPFRLEIEWIRGQIEQP